MKSGRHSFRDNDDLVRLLSMAKAPS